MPQTPQIDQNLAGRLVSALQQDEFVLYQQTILPVNPKPADRPFQEIYIRFTEEDEKMLPPGSFFPILEEHRLLPYLDRWVINRLARWVRSALRIKPDWNVPLSNVNLANATLADPAFPTYVMQYVDNSFLSDGALGFEIDVESVVSHAGPIQNLVATLRPYGCRFTLASVDESRDTLAAMKWLTPDFVKFSALSAASSKLTELIRRCRSLGTRTVIEHVENSKMLGQLRKARIDFAQGFEISPVRPL